MEHITGEGVMLKSKGKKKEKIQANGNYMMKNANMFSACGAWG